MGRGGLYERFRFLGFARNDIWGVGDDGERASGMTGVWVWVTVMLCRWFNLVWDGRGAHAPHLGSGLRRKDGGGVGEDG